MAWYVFALVDARPGRTRGEGAERAALASQAAGGFAVVERRADVPPVEFGTLKKHQDVVARLAEQVPAILPVRFGTLLEARRSSTRRSRSATTRSPRRSTSCAAACSSRGGSAGPGTDGSAKRDEGSASARQRSGTGAEYLRRAARAANPAPPAAFRALRAKLAPLIGAATLSARDARAPRGALSPRRHERRVDRYRGRAAALGHDEPRCSR